MMIKANYACMHTDVTLSFSIKVAQATCLVKGQEKLP